MKRKRITTNHDKQRMPPGVNDNDDAGPSPSEMAILAVIRKIPRGRVMTYGEVARRARLPGRARLVGRVLRTFPLADAVPWHRVIRADRRIADRTGPGATEQKRRLEAEGVKISINGCVE